MGSVDSPLTFLIDRQTAATSAPFQILDGPKDVVLTFTSEGTTSGGTLKIEESDLASYTGTWSQIGSDISASGFTGGAKQCVHVRLGAAGWVRVRISSSITGGGTVTVTVAGM